MALIKTSPFVDIHVHTREPGQTHKETLQTACAAAFEGGFGAIAAMANTSPVIDTPRLVRLVTEKAAGLPVTVYPLAAVTVGLMGKELTDFEALRNAGAVALSDDGMPVSDEDILFEAMLHAKKANMPILLHCEPETELCERSLFHVKHSGALLHICHVSRADTISVLRKAKKQGINFTAETCPHYMTVAASGKMNPPLGSANDVEAVLDALCDGVITCIATDHAPHTREEKESKTPPNGVIGLETALAVTLGALYHTKRMGAEGIFRLLCENPAAVLGVPIPRGAVTIDTDAQWTVDPALFKSKARNTPFAGEVLRGKVVSRDVC